MKHDHPPHSVIQQTILTEYLPCVSTILGTVYTVVSETHVLPAFMEPAVDWGYWTYQPSKSRLLGPILRDQSP